MGNIGEESKRDLNKDTLMNEKGPVQSVENVAREVEVLENGHDLSSKSLHESGSGRGQDTHSDPSIGIEVKEHDNGTEEILKNSISLTQRK